jgi:capsular exopolysaccharide family
MSNYTHTNQSDPIQIDLLDIARDLFKDLWLIIVFGLSVAMCAYVLTNVLYKPNYTTRATFVVTSKGADDTYLNLNSAVTVATSLSKIFESRVIKKKVAMDIGTDSVEGKITSKVIPETDLLSLSVTSSSPDMSYRIINSIMKNYTAVTDSMYGSAILDLMEAPQVPMKPDNPMNNQKNFQIYFLLGALIMTILLSVLSITRDNVKNEKELSKKLDTKLFGTVSHEVKYKTLRARLRRKKKSILLTSPTVSFSFTESFKKMRAKFEYKACQKSDKVLLITSVLENEGKSTVAVNLALALAQKSDYVLLVDGDLCKPAIFKILNNKVDEEHEIGNCMKSNVGFEDIVAFEENYGLYLALGSKRYENSTDLLSKDGFKKFIEVAKKVMDYIIIDAPPITVSADSEILADIADTSLLVVRQSMARTKDINDAIDILNSSNCELLGCVYNDVRKVSFGQKIGYGNAYSYQNSYKKTEKNSA